MLADDSITPLENNRFGEHSRLGSLGHMDDNLRRFLEAMGQLSGGAIQASAAAIRRSSGEEAGDDVLWWNATMVIDDTLRDEAHVVEAAAAAQRASDVVLGTARASGLHHDHPDVALLARRAKEVARGIVAGEAASDATAWLLSGWIDYIDFVLPPDPPKNLDPS